MTLAIVDSSSGAASASAMNDGDRPPASPAGSASRPRSSSTSCSRNRKRVATPKLPPPPRIAQKRSGWVSASTCRSSPSAVTTSAASRSSIVRPYLRTRNPTPPPSVIPPMPTEPGVAEPGREAVRARRGRVLARGQAGLGPRGAPLDVDVQRLHVREVEHDPSVGDADARPCCARRCGRRAPARSRAPARRPGRRRRRPRPGRWPPAGGRCRRRRPCAPRRTRGRRARSRAPVRSSRSFGIDQRGRGLIGALLLF